MDRITLIKFERPTACGKTVLLKIVEEALQREIIDKFVTGSLL